MTLRGKNYVGAKTFFGFSRAARATVYRSLTNFVHSQLRHHGAPSQAPGRMSADPMGA